VGWESYGLGVMIDLKERINNHLAQLSPHIYKRESARLLSESADYIDELEKQIKDMCKHEMEMAEEILELQRISLE